MQKTFFLLSVFILFLSCSEATKCKTPEEVFHQSLEKLEQAETLSYEVERIFASNDQRKMDLVFKIKKAGYEPHLGFFFYKEMNAQTKIYYKLASLTVVEDHKEKITVFDYGNDRSIPRYLKAYTEDEDNLLQLLKLLQEHRQNVKFLKEDNILDAKAYLYQMGTALMWLDAKTSLPIQLALESNLQSDGSIVKNGTTRFYNNILLNEEMGDDDFTAQENEKYITSIFGVQAEPLLNSQAIDWNLENTNGEIFSLSQFKGKYVFLEAWVSSCHHCIESIPKVKKIQQLFKSKLQVLTVNFDYDTQKTKSVIEKYDINYSVLLGNAPFDKDYDIRSFPSFYVIDPSGKIIYTNRGAISGEKEKELFTFLENLP